ncbi:hypothetical protein CFC21_077256, partial [Triticum aestivum]
MEASYML